MFSPRLWKLPQQLARAVGVQVLQRLHPAGSEGGDRTQQIGELTRGTGIEAAMSPMAEAGHLGEGARGLPIVAFLKHEQWHA
jgi:hypothetical protein